VARTIAGSADREGRGDPPRPSRLVVPAGLGATVAALGVVFGDIGTSPLYTLQAVFSIDHGAVNTTAAGVYGVLSLVFWSITIVVSVKYVLLVLRADNGGEGGVLALAALVRRSLANPTASGGAIVIAVGVFGAALFYGDSVITPAISVLSAVSGVKVAAPGLSEAVVPTAGVILAALFSVQRWGTGRIGALFGPMMLVWFLVLALTGLRQVAAHPSILRALSPSYGLRFIATHPNTAFIAMGAVVLAITGAEALFADLGHFGRRPIRRAWYAVVFPSLTLNYLGQGSIVLRDPATKASPFFQLVPHWAQIPLVALAAAATVIASQAVISGAFSVSQQAVQLGFLPRLRSRHTSRQNAGQVYVGAVNWMLFAAVLAVTVGFGSATRLATAYGVAVTGTFLITTALLLVLARTRWHWKTRNLVTIAIGIGATELTYFVANLTKITHGGWFPLLIALTGFTIMMTRHRTHGRATPPPTSTDAIPRPQPVVTQP
jgi:KUP system potassium uptake protein